MCRTAGDVKVEDTIPEGFDLIEGKSTMKFGSISAGMSVGMEYIVIPKAGNKKFQAAPAKVQYTSSKQNLLKKLFSTTPYIEVLSTKQNLELYAVQVVRPPPRSCPAVQDRRPCVPDLSTSNACVCLRTCIFPNSIYTVT